MRTLLVHCVKPTPWHMIYANQEQVSFIAQVSPKLKGFKLFDELLERAQDKFGEEVEVLNFSDL